MSVFRPKKRDAETGKMVESKFWWYQFRFRGQRIRESSSSTSKTLAKDAEQVKREKLAAALSGVKDQRKERIKTVRQKAAKELADYKARHKSFTFASYAIGHVTRHLGSLLVSDVDAEKVKDYQTARLSEEASPKSINDEVVFLLRLLERHGETIRIEMKKTLKLKIKKGIGKAYTDEEQVRLLNAARTAARSQLIYPAIMLALNTGMRDGEIRGLQWGRVDMQKGRLQIDEAKTEAGERIIPLNTLLLETLTEHREWFISKFGEPQPGWYLFPWGKPSPSDPTRSLTSFKSVWGNVKKAAGVTGRWHDLRHTAVTKLAEGGKASDGTIQDIAGHAAQKMLRHYSHIREEARRGPLEDIRIAATVERKKKVVPKVLDTKVATIPIRKGA